jgi:hypothetical protein
MGNARQMGTETPFTIKGYHDNMVVITEFADAQTSHSLTIIHKMPRSDSKV